MMGEASHPAAFMPHPTATAAVTGSAILIGSWELLLAWRDFRSAGRESTNIEGRPETMACRTTRETTRRLVFDNLNILHITAAGGICIENLCL
jgi:hypothetical protein